MSEELKIALKIISFGLLVYIFINTFGPSDNSISGRLTVLECKIKYMDK